MARQSIPRFDLYAALGVDPSADDAAIEAAYWDLFGQFGGDADTADDRRIVRARLAREWLTDPDRRARYDASRARAAARAAAKADVAGGAGAGAAGAADDEATAVDGAATDDEADDDADDEIADETIPWPAADLARQQALARHAAAAEQSEANIAWSSTPAEPVERPPRRRPATRSERRRVGLIGWGAVIVAGIAAVYLIYTMLGSTETAVNATPTPPPAVTQAGGTPTPFPPTAEPTALATTAPPPTSTPPDIDTVVMQGTSWQTLQSVIAAAEDGDVATAQALLGASAPGLRVSGLRRATFPDVTAQQMTITRDATGYVAMADETTRLTSVDGQAWTFDYGNRPLAAYRLETKPHDLWWTEGKVKHHIYLRLSAATVARTGVTLTAKWTFDPSLPDDATYFKRAALILTTVSFDGSDPIVIGTQPVGMAGTTSVITNGMFVAPVDPAVPDVLTLGITITNPRQEGGNDRAVETTFELAVR